MDRMKIERGASIATVEMTVIEVWYGIAASSLVERDIDDDAVAAAIFAPISR